MLCGAKILHPPHMKFKKVLAVFAHPDDEAFGPGGFIAKLARQGATVHLLSATKGEAGVNAGHRDKELLEAAKVLGIKRVEFLGFKDGGIGNNDLAKLESIITKKIKTFKPDLIITYDLNGISGHLDHIAIASATTQSFRKTQEAGYLYHVTTTKEYTDLSEKLAGDYFVYRPQGRRPEEIDLEVDIEDVWDVKVEAMYKHQSQMGDVKRILEIRKNLPKREYFIIRAK